MIAGIIPGNRGAIAWLNPDGTIFRTLPIPYNTTRAHNGLGYHMDATAFAKLLSQERIDHVVVERAASNDSAPISHAIGFASGIVEGVLAALCVQKMSVSYQQWRSDLSIPAEYWGAVDRVNDLTGRHWPNYRFDKSTGGHRKQLAALLALYAMQTSHGQALAA